MNKKAYSFTNVKEVRTPGVKVIGIDFTLHQHAFYLTVRMPWVRHNYYKPLWIYHKFEEQCPYCYGFRNSYGVCDVLSQSKVDLFHALVQQPAIRLTWLYRDYE